jgi:hypothetical protein
MKVETTKELKLKLKGTSIEHFKSALTKISNENKKVGFKSNLLNKDEIKVLNDINDKIE